MNVGLENCTVRFIAGASYLPTMMANITRPITPMMIIIYNKTGQSSPISQAEVAGKGDSARPRKQGYGDGRFSHPVSETSLPSDFGARTFFSACPPAARTAKHPAAERLKEADGYFTTLHASTRCVHLVRAAGMKRNGDGGGGEADVCGCGHYSFGVALPTPATTTQRYAETRKREPSGPARHGRGHLA